MGVPISNCRLYLSHLSQKELTSHEAWLWYCFREKLPSSKVPERSTRLPGMHQRGLLFKSTVHRTQELCSISCPAARMSQDSLTIMELRLLVANETWDTDSLPPNGGEFSGSLTTVPTIFQCLTKGLYLWEVPAFSHTQHLGLLEYFIDGCVCIHAQITLLATLVFTFSSALPPYSLLLKYSKTGRQAPSPHHLPSKQECFHSVSVSVWFPEPLVSRDFLSTLGTVL